MDDGNGSGAGSGTLFEELVEVMRTLRGPDGCPWDREQDFRSLRRYVLEEAHEVVEAIDEGDLSALRDELGDLLLQVVFLAQMADEERAFDVGDAVRAIRDKMIRRHPHVFGDEEVEDSRQVLRNWEAIKRRERGEPEAESLLDDISPGLPALVRAEELGRRAARIAFDWSEPPEVVAKAREELKELEAALGAGAPDEKLEEEVGDLLFSVAHLARHLGSSPELALRRANAKFERRFREVERALAEGRIGDRPEDLEAEWERVKARE